MRGQLLQLEEKIRRTGCFGAQASASVRGGKFQIETNRNCLTLDKQMLQDVIKKSFEASSAKGVGTIPDGLL